MSPDAGQVGAVRAPGGHGGAGSEEGAARLEGHLGCPTASPLWFRAALDTLHPPADWRLVEEVGPNGAPAAFAPLVRGRGGGRGRHERLEVAGARDTTEPVDFPHQSPEHLAALIDRVRALRTPLLLHRVFADAPLVDVLRGRFRRRAVIDAREVGGCPYLALDDGWRDPESKFSARRRSDFRRMRRRALEQGAVALQALSPDEDAARTLWPELLDVEHDGWKGEAQTSLRSDARRRAFYARYARAAAAAGELRVFFLRVGGRASAMQVAVERQGALFLLKIGYRQSDRAFSPGSLLMLHTLEWAAARGLSSLEFLGFPSEWSRMWTRTERACVALRVYPLAGCGLTLLGRDVAEAARRRLRRNRS